MTAKLIAAQLSCALILGTQPTMQERRTVPDPSVNPTGAAVKAFLDRVNAYVALQKKVSSDLPKLNGDATPSAAEAHQAAMAARVRLARPNPKRGEIFGDVEPIVRAVVNNDKEFRSLRDRRAAMEEVPPFDPPKLNAAYPEKLPLATVPSLILDQFPRLPDGHLEYRFMGNDLRDVMANLIVDFINNAVPASRR